MNLIHYSEHPFSLDEFIDFHGREKFFKERSCLKPFGLWVTDNKCAYNWSWFCKEANFQVETLEYAHSIILEEDANILLLKSCDDIDNFTEEYKKDSNDNCLSELGFYIDWDKLSLKHDGIIITPYQWERRNHHNTHWYYTWDCASGCIWRKRAIKDIQLIEK